MSVCDTTQSGWKRPEDYEISKMAGKAGKGHSFKDLGWKGWKTVYKFAP